MRFLFKLPCNRVVGKLTPVLKRAGQVSGLPTSRQLTGNIWHRVFRFGISRTCERVDVNYLPVLASGFENRD